MGWPIISSLKSTSNAIKIESMIFNTRLKLGGFFNVFVEIMLLNQRLD